MTQDCTALFLHYRETCRIVWNLGFCKNPHIRKLNTEYDFAFEAVAADLFETLVLLPLGFRRSVDEYPHGLGKPVRFAVKVTHPDGTALKVDMNPPEMHMGEFSDKGILFPSQPHQLRFMQFADWRSGDMREFQMLGVLIERLDHMTGVMGHNAFVETTKCSIWLDEEPDE